MSVRIEGMGRLRVALLRVTGEGEKAVRREVKRSALNVQNGARRRVPVDTGRLRNSIAHEIDADGMDATIGSNVEYAPYVEFGTENEDGTVRMRAQPYLFPALEEERAAFVARLRTQLGAAFVRATD